MKNFLMCLTIIAFFSCKNKKSDNANFVVEEKRGNEELISLVEKELFFNINDPESYEFVSLKINNQTPMSYYYEKIKKTNFEKLKNINSYIQVRKLNIAGYKEDYQRFPDNHSYKGHILREESYLKEAQASAEIYYRKNDSINEANKLNGEKPYKTYGEIKFRDINEMGVKVLKKEVFQINHLDNRVIFEDTIP